MVHNRASDHAAASASAPGHYPQRRHKHCRCRTALPVHIDVTASGSSNMIKQRSLVACQGKPDAPPAKGPCHQAAENVSQRVADRLAHVEGRQPPRLGLGRRDIVCTVSMVWGWVKERMLKLEVCWSEDWSTPCFAAWPVCIPVCIPGFMCEPKSSSPVQLRGSLATTCGQRSSRVEHDCYSHRLLPHVLVPKAHFI